MAFLNENYLKLKAGYLFPEIARRVKAFCEADSAAAQRLIRCGIGDVTEPLPPAVIAALHRAVDEMAERATGVPLSHARLHDAAALSGYDDFAFGRLDARCHLGSDPQLCRAGRSPGGGNSRHPARPGG